MNSTLYMPSKIVADLTRKLKLFSSFTWLSEGQLWPKNDVDHSQDINLSVSLLCVKRGHWDSFIPLQIIKQLLQKDYGKTGWHFQMNSLTEKIYFTKHKSTFKCFVFYQTVFVSLQKSINQCTSNKWFTPVFLFFFFQNVR